MKGFLEHGELFFIEATVQVKQRFPINDPILSSLTFLDPSAVSNAQQFWMLLQNVQTSLLQMTYRDSTVSGANIDPKIHMDHYRGDVAALTDGCGEIYIGILCQISPAFECILLRPKLLLSKLSNGTDLKHPHWILF